jgi:hypothetical protein
LIPFSAESEDSVFADELPVGDIIPQAATPVSVLMEALDDAREFGRAAIDVRRRLRLQSGPKAALVT